MILQGQSDREQRRVADLLGSGDAVWVESVAQRREDLFDLSTVLRQPRFAPDIGGFRGDAAPLVDMVFEPIDVFGELLERSVLVGRRWFAVTLGPSGHFGDHGSLRVSARGREERRPERQSR